MKKIFNKEDFVSQYKRVKGVGFKNNTELAHVLGFKSPNSITEITSGRQSITDVAYAKFVEAYSDLFDENNPAENKTKPNQIPMYNLPAAAGEVEVYSNPDDVKIVGYMNLPGAHKDSVALPAYGHSMYPTIANGDWAVSRPINDPTEIVWGEVYYIEWSDYKMYKRLLKCEDNADEVILWSDNQLDKIGNYPKYAALNIKKESIRRLRLVTEILKKPNY